MSSSSLFEHAVETAQRIWQIEPVRDIRMPELNAKQTVAIDVLWTDGGLRPRANNLAFLIQQVSNRDDLERWKQRLKAWTVRGGLLVLDDLYLVQPRSDSSGYLEQEELDLESWYQTLVSPKPHLFTPKALATLRQGQLSLADLEETVSERSFTFLTRQQLRIDTAFQEGIDAAIKVVQTQKKDPYTARIQGHVIRYSIAYLAARILQDKNFFGSGASIHSKDQDPVTLLDRMIERTNGFFSRAKESEEFICEHTRPLFDRIRQELVQHMGYNVSFVLTDHRDVGRLYEEAIKKLPRELGSDDWGDLNRHYTPVKLAERMLEALPLERLRPEERFIFDPAAGSGSLLLAATSRLAGMTDIPVDDERNEYLRSHITGNDLDRYASLIAQLRYFLASESLGIASETSKIADVLPFPFSFTNENYKKFTQQTIPIRPRIIVANPPFAIEGNIQNSASFVEQFTNWLYEGDQFAFVLPSSFLTGGNKFGVSKIRKNLSKRCDLFEIWQCPEGTVGVDARQDVCVLIGTVGKNVSQSTISRAVISRAEAFAIREGGFLGPSWISRNNANENWTNIIAPININVPTVPLASLFFVFNGIKHYAGNTPVKHCPENKLCKPTWRMRWRKEGSLWADPKRVDQEMRWVVYDSESLERPRFKVKDLFDLPKILIGRISNRASNNPLTVQLDTVGFCPNDSVWCLLPIEEAQKFNKGYSSETKPSDWENLSFEDKRLWLLGILSTSLAAELSMSGRSTITLTENVLCQFPLPALVDRKIIDVVRQIVKRDQSRSPIPQLDPLIQELNCLVEASYGNPNRIKLQRTGLSSGLEEWQLEERKKTLTVTGQVLEVSQENLHILLRLSGLVDDNEEEWIPLPQELPGWALDGTVFRAELSEDIETFQELAQRPWALKKFRHTPYPYLTNNDLKAKLSRIVGLENS